MSINKNKSPILRSFPDEPEASDNEQQQKTSRHTKTHYSCSICHVSTSWKQYVRHLKSWQHLTKKRLKGFETECEDIIKRKAEYELEDCIRKVRRRCENKDLAANSQSTMID